MTEEKAKNIAEKIALLLQENEKGSNDYAALRSGIEKINERLNKIETKLDSQNSNNIQHSPFTFHGLNHPSLDKFANLEEIADEIFNSMPNEKACPYEPTGKPCDHCAMCGSRGF
ncbi:MAG: hypothetical protein H0U50_04380 [Pyrinomonadaceae bacterium]|nr:hypothetical protein [Pyrinomonadaceae bacterium]